MNKQLHIKEKLRLILLITFILGTTATTMFAEIKFSSTINENTLAALQQRNVTLQMRNASIKAILYEIQKQTDLSFIYNDAEMAQFGKKTLNLSNTSTDKVLSDLFEGTSYTFSIEGSSISIYKKVEQPQQQKRIVMKGKVISSDNKKPITGATILVKGSTTGAISDDKGQFSFSVLVGAEVEVSYVGMKTAIVKVADTTNEQVISLLSDAMSVSDVIVTGIFERKKESFTGSASVYTSKDLKMVGNMNVLQSLKSLDPAFAILENNQFGSDPNRLPEIEIRGKTSVAGLSSEFGTDPNQPLFILDGFETTLKTITDLSMDRVQSITVLKDAAATAIYGSKAANGVVVVETVMPEIGKLKVSYNGNFGIGWADLSAYNLMNSKEKLEFEKLSGYYGKINANGDFVEESKASQYYSRLAEAMRGVDSYWMSDPLRVAFKHTHNVYIDGGDEVVRYGFSFNYGNTQGVMKDSDKETISGNFKFIYRYKNLNFSNNLTINYSSAQREKVAFSEYSSTNPFFRKTNELGDYPMILESFTDMVYESANYQKTVNIYNPLYNNSLGSSDINSGFGFTNNTEVVWQIMEGLKAKARFSFTKNIDGTERFVSPFHSKFIDKETILRGSYDKTNGSGLRYDADANVTYFKLLNDVHLINAVAGMRMAENSSASTSFSTFGFIDDEYSNPQFSAGYQQGTKPSYSESISRSMSGYFNIGYAYDNRYMTDVSLRIDGSSVFGSTKKFTKSWSVGLSWNIHKEKFMENLRWISLLKVRGSIGNPGNQNFDAGISMKTYRYNNTYQNPFGLSTVISKFGNRDLEWQKTLDRNIGVDINLFDKLTINFDIYKKVTDPLLIDLTVSSSAGTKSVPKNFGSSITKGGTLSLTYRLIQKQDFLWSINGNARMLDQKFDRIGNSLDSYNQKNQSRSLVRYYDGASSTDLWAVRSNGIDPATGRELFIKKDGTQTFVYDYDDEVVIGDSTPFIEGTVGTSLYYKGFSLSMSLRYKQGGDVFMSALFNKVENITSTSLQYNQDRRALYDRWQKPGDVSKFKSISSTESTKMSSRFVAEENLFSGESISFGYETQAPFLKRMGISSLDIRAYMNDIFRISSVKNERGIDYPFERSVSFSLGVRF